MDALHHHAQLGAVTIEVVEGKELIAMDSNGTSDPYVVCVVGTKKKKTKIIRDTLNPQWTVGDPEIFKFKVRNNVDKIILECYDWDRFNTDDRMGMIVIPLSAITDEKQHDEWHTLVPMKTGDPVAGQLHIKIQFTSVITGKYTKNPLVVAIKAGESKNVVSILSHSDCDPNTVDAEHSTPLHLAAVGANHQILSALLNNRKVLAKAVDKDGNTALHIFSQKFVSPNNCEEIVGSFLERGVDINARNAKHETPLHKACLNESVRVVMAETLLKRGAKVNEVTIDGQTPMDYSIRLGREDLCDLLVRNGASPQLEPQIELAKKLKFTRIADKLRAFYETYEWFQRIGLPKVGAECVKSFITKDLLPQLKDSDLAKLGFADKKEKDMFLNEVGRLQQAGSKRVSLKFKEKLEKLNDEEDRHHRLVTSSMKYSKSDDDDWEIDFESLEFSESLGKGASGQVYLGYYGGKKVAIKILPDLVDDEFAKEFQIIRHAHAPHIVNFYGACLKTKLCIVMEFCEQGSLFDVLSRPNIQIGWDKIFNWALGIVHAIHSLHNCKPSIMHRDLKSLNVLVTSDGTAKVCDFGLSRFDTSSNMGTMGKLRGTYHYVAPELYTGKKFTFASDVYSVGIILWELANRVCTQKYAYPFSEFPNLTQDFQVLIAAARKDQRPTVPPTCPSPLKDIILKCYSKNPLDRPTTSELIESLTHMKKEFEKDPQPWTDAIIPL